ncbi:MAG: flagellar hook-associated protein FlgK [Phycisphaeraceae bacterium]|nr:flagellar hook-associated protein FlgK [Phycisphaeraceae bacterium]
MTLSGALYTGRSGILASQVGLDVVGNNMANAATEGYVRRSAIMENAPVYEHSADVLLGTGVQVQNIARFVDEALLQRLRLAIADQQAASVRQEILAQIETVEAELSDLGLTSRFSTFFNSLSDLANNPTDLGLRTLVIEEGQSLSNYLNTLHGDLVALRQQVDSDLRQSTIAADDLLDRIAELNGQIVTTEATAGGGSALRDERDRLLKELAELVEIHTVEQPAGSVDVFIQSIPVVLGDQSRGLEIEFETAGDQLEVRLRVKADGSSLTPATGRIGQLMVSREEDVNGAIVAVNETARSLMEQFNRIHSSGQGLVGFDSVTSFSPLTDPAAALNAPPTADELPFVVNNGSFEISVTQLSTGTRQTTLIPIDLDGVGPETSLNDLAAAIDAVDNISASVGADGRLTISADSADFQIGFAQDTSGVLTALGINTFFTGAHAGDIDVNQVLQDNPALFAAAQDFVTGDNRNALALSSLIDQPLEALGGQSLRGQWQNHVQDFATRTAQSGSDVAAKSIVAEGLEAQRQSVSGVNVDEEAINLLAFQRAFQASARFLTVVDELMGTLLGII